MDARKYKGILFSTVVFSLSSFCQISHAASNFSVTGVGVRGHSMQAFVAVADDPSTIYYNPAGLTQLKGTQVQGNITGVFPKQSYIRNANHVRTTSDKVIIAPDLFATSDHVLNGAVVGVGIYAPFGRMPDYDPNAAVNFLTERASLVRFDVVPTIAFHITPAISFGLSAVASYVDTSTNMLGVKEDASGYGATGQAGILLQLSKTLRLGASYRGFENVELSGEGKSNGLKSDFTAHLRFPATASVGLAWQITPKFLGTVEFDEEFWSYLKQVSRKYDSPGVNPFPTTPVDGRDVLVTRVGAMYRPNFRNEFRAGYSYIPAAIPTTTIAPAQPDYNVNAFSVGYSRYYKHFRFDAGYEFAFQPYSRPGNSPVPTYQGKYKMHVNVLMLGINYQFA